MLNLNDVSLSSVEKKDFNRLKNTEVAWSMNTFKMLFLFLEETSKFTRKYQLVELYSAAGVVESRGDS